MKKILSALFGLVLLLPAAPPARAQMVNAQTGTTYTVVNTDCDPQGRKLLTINNSGPVAVSLPQAGAGGSFLSGCVINVENTGLGAVTITPTTSTINGAATLTLNSGAGAAIFSDATPVNLAGNYWTNLGSAGPNGFGPNFRNFLDNGNMALSQRSESSSIACGGTTGTTSDAGYGPDRWACIVNVGSQAGKIQTVTSTPTPPTGFKQSVTIWRNANALTQPVCLMQEVPYADALSLQGQTATFSAQIQALAGLSADNGNAANMYIMTGTAANGDQGLASMTASPAITPAWTGISSSITKAVTLTTGWVRYSVTGVIPAATTEVAVAICFTPTASGSGSTDGLAVVGAQLEQGVVPTPYEFKPFVTELQKAETYFFQVADLAATYTFPSSCNVTTANTTVKCSYILPVQMRAVPTVVVGTATSFGIWLTAGTAGTCSTLAAAASNSTVQTLGLTCTTAGTIALGAGTALIGGASSGVLSGYADF